MLETDLQIVMEPKQCGDPSTQVSLESAEVSETDAKDKVVRRKRPKNDRLDLEAMKADLEPLVDKKKGGLSLDFRCYGKMKRTGGSG